MSERALSFGAVAEAYERFRPGYPDDVFDLVDGYATRPLRTALEIGAGTGKATRLFAGHGVAVTAVEPDAAMLAELRRHVPPTVRTVNSTFERVPVDRRYDLVFAAAALHWTEPSRRWHRVAGLLESGGTFASFGGQLHLADPEIEAAVCEARAPFLDSDEFPSPDRTPAEDDMQWPGTELRNTELFDDVRQVVIARTVTMSGTDFVGHLSTVSAYLQLPERELVYERIREVLPETVELTADNIVHLATRTPVPAG